MPTTVFHIHRARSKEEAPWTAGGSGNPYSGGREVPSWQGFRVELWCGGPDGIGGDEHFELHGDGETVKQFLKTALSIVEATEAHCRKQVVDQASRAHHCHACGGWVVLTTYGNYIPDHGDGHGNSCTAAGQQVGEQYCPRCDDTA